MKKPVEPIEIGMKQLYALSGIMESWYYKEFSDYTNDKNALEKVESYLKQCVDFKDEGIGLFLWGANGTGKSHLLNCLFKKLLEKRYKVRIVSFSALIENYTNGWYKDDAKAIFRELKHCDFLAIEEIGKELEMKNNAVVINVLDNLLRFRLQSNKPTFITSNLKPSEIELKYTPDIASMLKEGSVPVQVMGSDFRDKIKDKIKLKL